VTAAGLSLILDLRVAMTQAELSWVRKLAGRLSARPSRKEAPMPEPLEGFRTLKTDHFVTGSMRHV